jgi:hypothetical protein
LQVEQDDTMIEGATLLSPSMTTAIELSADYERLFADTLRSAGSWHPRAKAVDELSCCWPEFGTQYRQNSSILIVGRATNGFENPFTSSDLRDPVRRDRIVSNARTFAQTERLSWMANGSLYAKRGGTVATRSAFWRASRFLACAHDSRLNELGSNWWQGVGWTNLSKVSPYRGGRGNPADRLWGAQRETAVAALSREVTEAQPSLVVAFWPDSLFSEVSELLELRIVKRDGGLAVPHIGSDGARPWLFAKRPDSRSKGSQDAFIGDLLAAHREVT